VFCAMVVSEEKNSLLLFHYSFVGKKQDDAC